MFNSVHALKKCNVRVIVDIISLARAAAKSNNPGNFSELVKVVSQLTIKDDFAGFYTCAKCKLAKSDYKSVSYTKILETPLISMGLFHVHPRLMIPLHDHPNMTGVIKVLRGSLNFYTFNKKNDVGEHHIEAELTDKRTVTCRDPCAIVEPNKNNIHHIENATDECACFFDILFPAYTESNKISYYSLGHNYNKAHDYKLQDVPLNSSHQLLKLLKHPKFFITDVY